MKKITLLFLSLLTLSLGYSQGIPVTFSEGITAASWKADSGLASVAVVADPATGTGDVGQMNSSDAAGAQDWQNAQITFQDGFYKMDLSGTNKTITFDYYSNEATGGLLKIENGVAAENKELPFSYNTANVWETITLDFSTVGANAQYNKLVFFPHLGNGGPKNSTKISYIDNVNGEIGDLIGAGPSPASGADVDEYTTYYSLFSDESFYTSVAPSSWTQGWGAGSVADFIAGTDNTKKYENLGFQAVTLGELVDVSGYTHFHIDVWTPVANAVAFKLEDYGVDGVDEYPNVDDTEQEVLSSTAQTAETWVGHDFAIADYSSMNTTNIGRVQIILGNATGGTVGTAYVDNLYFYDSTTLGTTNFELVDFNVFPNPSQNAWNIKTNNTLINTVNVFDILGKQVISLSPESTEVKIDGSSLTSGIYIAKIATPQGVSNVRLVRK